MGQEEDTEGPMPVAPEAGPGASLTAAREQAGLSLMQAADRLHLDVSAVKALESGRFEVLGAAVHVRGHLRRYAELLGLPAQEVEKQFLELHPARSTPDLRHGAGLLQKSDAGKRALRPGTAALGALVIVIIGVVLWARRVPHTHEAPSRPVASAATVSPPVANAVNAADVKLTAAAPAPSAPAGGALDGTAVPSRMLPGETADSAARFNGEPGTLWDPAVDSAARRSPVDGGGGVSSEPTPHAESAHAAAKTPARKHGTRP
jgi:cytoskeleton protein RodZ